uniref:Uncharacterized protein n=1 Tax=Hordeum vulgare subsp. vulgare TaxID=112509 RepID=A0A8I7BED3_HORVV
MLARRSTSDLSSFQGIASASVPASQLPDGAGDGTPVLFRMPLPKAQVEKLMGESRDAAEAAAKIMELCAAVGDGGCSAKVTPERPTVNLRSPRFDATPEWGSGFRLPKSDGRRSSRSGFCGAPRCRRLLFAAKLCSPPSASGSGCPRILPCHCWFPSFPPRPALVALLDWHAGGIRSWRNQEVL